MWKKTLASVCFILALTIVWALEYLACGRNSLSVRRLCFASDCFIYCCATAVSTSDGNQYILAWRKRCGRDIEAEEKHEFDEADIISLRPRQPNEHSST